ncbi:MULTISPECIES: hypothetical protein [Streptosporangium]|uniref:Uncharacterized protein n=1 Tax=Streptosporangium brasiliense TaxID=47480 RepID=A0ABT9R465_9ACTN|nr:hypothetical protein [Streptosporangium brasiliense]MDP9864026.1 hypothetical protein [Streptosporangium brasiliense]
MTRPTTVSTPVPYALAAALVADLDGQHRRERQAYEQGYRDGHRSGWEIGYGHAHQEMADRWAALAAQIRNLSRTPTHAELEVRRWDGRREDFGRPRPGDRQGRRLAAANATAIPRRRSA